MRSSSLFMILQDHLLAGVGRVGDVRERGPDRGPDLLVGRPRGLRGAPQPGRVDVDLDRPAGPAGLGQVGVGLADRRHGLAWRRGAGTIALQLEAPAAADVERLAVDRRLVEDVVRVDRVPLRREAVVGPGEGRRVAAHQGARDAELLVGVRVGAADVALAVRDATGGPAAGALDVVELRVRRRSTGSGRRRRRSARPSPRNWCETSSVNG